MKPAILSSKLYVSKFWPGSFPLASGDRSEYWFRLSNSRLPAAAHANCFLALSVKGKWQDRLQLHELVGPKGTLRMIQASKCVFAIFLGAAVMVAIQGGTGGLAVAQSAPPSASAGATGSSSFIQWGLPAGFDGSRYPTIMHDNARKVMYVLASSGDLSTQQKLIGEFISQMEGKGTLLRVLNSSLRQGGHRAITLMRALKTVNTQPALSS